MRTLATIVNYMSADMTLKAVQSILDSESIGPLLIVVVDNSNNEGEAEILRLNLPPHAKLIINPENMGFGRACNQVFDQLPGEFVLLMNPDARLRPGSLLRIQKTLASSHNIAAVSARIFWDEELTYFLPPSPPPSFFFLQPFFDVWGAQNLICRILSRIWRWHSVRVWNTKTPIKVNNLSGGLVLLRRESVQKAGGLFDPRFFLYFEDTDLFFRLKKAGYSLVIEPRAKAIHYYNQCGLDNWDKKRSLMERAHKVFLEKHSNGFRSRMRKVAMQLSPDGAGRGNRVVQTDFISPFTFEVPCHLHKGWLFEMSPNQTFIPSAGRFGKGSFVDFTEKCWRLLAPGQYFGRLGNPGGFRGCSRVISWTVGKNT